MRPHAILRPSQGAGTSIRFGAPAMPSYGGSVSRMSTQPPSDMPEDSQSISRLLEAISPGLTAELFRILDEHREKLRAEANVQLKAAILERETELQAASEAETVRLRAETTEQVRKDVTRELESQFEQKLSKELRALKDRLDGASGEAQLKWQQERSELTDESVRWRVLSDFYRRTGTVISQAEILKRFLKAGGHYAGGIVLYLNKPDGLRRWGTEGEISAFPELVSEDTRDPEWYWVPVTVRSRTVLAVGATGVEDREALDALVGALKRAIENLGLRLGVRAAELNEGSANGGSVESVTQKPDAIL